MSAPESAQMLGVYAVGHSGEGAALGRGDSAEASPEGPGGQGLSEQPSQELGTSPALFLKDLQGVALQSLPPRLPECLLRPRPASPDSGLPGPTPRVLHLLSSGS